MSPEAVKRYCVKHSGLRVSVSKSRYSHSHVLTLFTQRIQCEITSTHSGWLQMLQTTVFPECTKWRLSGASLVFLHKVLHGTSINHASPAYRASASVAAGIQPQEPAAFTVAVPAVGFRLPMLFDSVQKLHRLEVVRAAHASGRRIRHTAAVIGVVARSEQSTKSVVVIGGMAGAVVEVCLTLRG